MGYRKFLAVGAFAAFAHAAHAVTVNAGADVTTTWPTIQTTLAGSVSSGSAAWTQVSGPATARIRHADAPTTTVALPSVGSYVFRLSGDAGASDEVAVTVAAATALSATSTVSDHLAFEPRPVWRTGNRLLRLNNHDFGLPLNDGIKLAQDWNYNLLLRHNKSIVGTAAANFPITVLIQHVVSAKFAPTSMPAGATTADLVCNADGEPINFGTATSVQYYLSPLAPDDLFTTAGRNLGLYVKTNLIDKGANIVAIANQGEYGIGLSGQWGASYVKDPRFVTARGSETTGRFLSRQSSRQERLIKAAFLAATGLPETTPYFAYQQSYGPERGRWSSWPGWMNYFEDYVDFNTHPGPEFYIDGEFKLTQTDGAGTSTSMVLQALNTVAGQIKMERKLMVPWVSPGGWTQPADNKALCSRDRYTGFLKFVFSLGSITVLQDAYSDDKRITGSKAIGTEQPAWIWGLIDAAKVHALFSYLDDYLLDGDLIASTNTHPYINGSDKLPFYAFQPLGDTTAWVVARKLTAENRWLLCAYAAAGDDRDIQVTLPTLGTVNLRARALGSVYVARYDGDTLVITQVDGDSQAPTRLLFPDETRIDLALEGRTAPVVIDPAAGSLTAPTEVSLSCATSGSTIRYTLDGTTPTTSSGLLYDGPITLAGNRTLTAIASKNGLANSPVATAVFTFSATPAATPQFSPAAGIFTTAQTVTLSTSTAGATLRYTLDGTEPSRSKGTDYTGPFSVSSTTTVKAIAYGADLADSALATGAYVIAPGDCLLGLTTPALTDRDTIAAGTNLSGRAYGMRFRATADGRITGLRVWQPLLGPTELSLWDSSTSSGTRIARVTIPAATQAGWVEAPLDTPVAIIGSRNYTVSYAVYYGNTWASTLRGLKVQKTSGRLISDEFNGRFRAQAVGMPTDYNINNYHNYWVDVRYTAAPTAAQLWREQYFGSAENITQGADTADPDGDGVNNLLEYALGGDPLQSGTGILPVVSTLDGKLQLTFTRSRSDVTYTVEATSDLETWTTIATNPGTVGESVTVADTVTLADNPKRFLRLKATPAP